MILMGWRRSLAQGSLKVFSNLKVWDAVYASRPKHLTVLAYHRVVDSSGPDFDTFQPNVSASPAEFETQMDYIASKFTVIDITALLAWLKGEDDLPDRPLLITFDDGYRDNYEFAFRALRERDLPAVLFITTQFIGSERAFYWDQLAYTFHHTRASSFSFEPLGQMEWSDSDQRHACLRAVIANLKQLTEQEKTSAVDKILEALPVEGRPVTPLDLAMSWDQVREMSEHGIAIGGHTHTHPILTRISLPEAQNEINTCLDIIKREIGKSAQAFAYTNGLNEDFSPAHEQILDELGIQAAFSLIPGPSPLDEVQARPLAIRRVMVHHRDDLARFEAKLGGAARLLQGLF